MTYIETKDAAPGPNDQGNVATVIEDVKNEIKGLGDDYKKKFTALEQSLATMRTEWEEAIKASTEETGETKTKMDSWKTEVQTRIDDLLKKSNERLDHIETRMKRLPEHMESQEDAAEIHKAATEFTIWHAARRGIKLDPHKIEPNIDNYRAYAKVFKKYLRNGEQSLSPEDFKALTEGVDSEGGYLALAPELSNRIITKIFETSPIRALATVERTASGEIDLLVDIDEPDAGWTTETATPTTTGTPTVAKKTIVAHECYAAPKATMKLLEDASINIEAWLAGKVSGKLGRLQNTAFVLGTGVGQPRGFLTYAAGTAWGQIPQVLTGVDSGFKYIDAAGGSEGLVNILGTLKEDYHANATWLTNRAGFVNLLSVQDGDNRYIFAPQMIQGTRQAFIPTLLGYPLRMAADMPALATNSLSIAFADWAQAYTIIDRLGITVQRDPFTKKPYVEFYTRARVGGDVVNFEAIVIGKCNT